MENQKVWVVVSYDPFDHHTPDIIGVYSTKKLAHNEILNVLEQEFRGMSKGDIKIMINGEQSVSHESDSDYEKDNNGRFEALNPDKVTWEDVKKIIEEELCTKDEIRDLSDTDHYVCKCRVIK